VWEEETILTNKVPMPFGCTIVIQVWDYDCTSMDDMLGTATFTLGPPTPADDVFDFDVPLKSRDTNQATLSLKLTGARPPLTLLAKRSERELAVRDSRNEDTFSQNSSQEEWPAPEDKLMRPDLQSWALVFLVLSLLVDAFYAGLPISCVRPPDKKVEVTTCKGILTGDSLASVHLDMPNFCWTGCMQSYGMAHLLLLALALTAQSCVVIMNADKFLDWMGMTFYVDLWDFSELAKDSLNDPEEDPEYPENERFRQGLGKFLKFVRKPMENKLKKTLLLKARGLVENSSKSVAARLSSARSVNILVKMSIAVCFCNVSSHMFFSFSTNSVFFRCQEKDKDLWSSTKHDFVRHMHYVVLLAKVAEAVCLLMAAVCVFRARWACHLIVKPVDYGTSTAAQRLRAHFKVEGKTVTGLPRYVPKFTGGFPEDDLLPLSIMDGQHLVGVRHRGILYEKTDLEWLMGFHEGPEQGNQMMLLDLAESNEVTLLFKPEGRDLMDYFIYFWKMAKNPDRGASIALHSMASVTMIVAAMSCWTCVAGINVKADAALTVSSVDKRLMLLGACGRFRGIGNATFLAGLSLLLSVAQQLLIMFLYDEKITDVEEHSNPQLTATVLDVRKNSDLNIEKFEEAEAEIAESEERKTETAFAMCYVWVEGRENRVADATVRSFRLDESALAMRATWTRSSKPRKVRLVRKSAARRKQMLQGLPGDHGPPSICIEVLDARGEKKAPEADSLARIVESMPPKGGSLLSQPLDDNEERLLGSTADASEVGCQQIVPVQFIAGFCHADVNLGPKLAWEAMSQTLALVAIMLAGLDIGFFFLGTQSWTLGSCKDVTNEATCFSFNAMDLDSYGQVDFAHLGSRLDKGQPVDFRPSVGPWLSVAATALAAVGLLALRVAGDTRKVERPRPFRATVGQYCEALCSGVMLVTGVVSWACDSLKAGFRNTWCWRKHAFRREFSVSPPGTPLEGYTQLAST